MISGSQSLVSARSRRRLIGVVIALLVVLVAGTAVTVVDAQGANTSGSGDDKITVDRKCTGGWFDKKTCQMMNAGIGWVLNAIANFVESIINGIMGALVGTPVPKHNGEPAIVQPPTNQPWKGLYNSWLTFAVPLGLVEWILMVMGVLFSQVYISDPSTELKRRELKHRTWKVLFAILGSWALGATVLHISNALTRTIAPKAEHITGNLAVLVGNGQAVALGAIFVWLFGGMIFLFVFLLLLAKLAVVFVMMWNLPVLLPLAAFDVGPIRYLSKPARGLIDMFIPFVFLTLPMALVLRVGYITVTNLNQTSTAQLGMHFSGMNGLIILGFWLIAAISPLFVFRHTGQIKGFAAGMVGAAVMPDIDGLGGKVKDAKGRVDPTPPPNVNEATDITDGSPFQRSNAGGFGGTLGGGGGTNRESMLGGGSRGPSDGFTAGPAGSVVGTAASGTALSPGTGGGPSGASTSSASGGKTGTGTTAETDTASDRMVSSEDIVQVGHPRDLPSETKFNVGCLKDNGEFRPLNGDPNYTRSGVLTNYNRLNTTRHYQDRKLLVQSQEDGSYFDLDTMTYRDQSYEQMSQETSEDVLNS